MTPNPGTPSFGKSPYPQDECRLTNKSLFGPGLCGAQGQEWDHLGLLTIGTTSPMICVPLLSLLLLLALILGLSEGETSGVGSLGVWVASKRHYFQLYIQPAWNSCP